LGRNHWRQIEHGLFRGAGIVNHHRHTLMFYPELCPPKRASSANSSRLPSNGLNFLQAGEPKKANKEYDELYRLKGSCGNFPIGAKPRLNASQQLTILMYNRGGSRAFGAR